MNQSPSYTQRQSVLNTLENDYFDVIIIGGGITGAGIALDAATRGLKVALIEQKDFASGTSSRSTKLIHGGLRYLKQFEFNLVREVGKERAILHNLATHLVRPEKMLLPLTKDGSYGKIIASVGLMVYDVLADVDKEDQRKMLTPKQTLEMEPLLGSNPIEGGGLYSEYQTDDFRLVIELLKASQNEGATVINYTKCTDFITKGGTITGVRAKDMLSNNEYQIYGDYVINASGPWSDDIRRYQEEVTGKKLFLTKGVHVVIPFEKLPVKQSIYFDVPDGRMMFAIPRKGVTYLGTSDTKFEEGLAEVKTSVDDVHYILDAVNSYFPNSNLSPDDIVSSWAGVRPLIEEEGKSASEISRKDEIFISDHGLITIAGGKLTGYRKMAKRAVEVILNHRNEDTGKKIPKCKTKKYKLPGNTFKNPKAVSKFKKNLLKSHQDLKASEVSYLVDLYGSQAEQIIADAAGSSLIQSEVRFCVEHEWTLHITDFFVQRTGQLFFEIENVEANLPLVAQEMKKLLGWTEEQMKEEIALMQREIDTAQTFD